MSLVQVVSAVHFVLKARLLLDGVFRAELRGDHPQHWSGTVREDKRLEYRPVGVNGERKRGNAEIPSTQSKDRM